MKTRHPVSRREHLTYKGNLRETRHGWLRLTPAYSLHLVTEVLEGHTNRDTRVLDPFCGTGTTALVCAETGIPCDTTDINPFLIWLAEAKTRPYDSSTIARFQAAAADVRNAMQEESERTSWTPPLRNIEKWWDPGTLCSLSRGYEVITRSAATLPDGVAELLLVTFCRTLIHRAKVSFAHQSMSFKKPSQNGVLPFSQSDNNFVAETWDRSVASIGRAARSPILASPNAVLCDARSLDSKILAGSYDLVVTSPPYPNRMSYIRELRPYMYWLGYLQNAKAAGELDWLAIGGTWGSATSNLTRWGPDTTAETHYSEVDSVVHAIRAHSTLLSQYVRKYFYDMDTHCRQLYRVVRPGGVIKYIVGNSKFYDVLVPVERFFATLFEAVGFRDVDIDVVRKRSSKKELFEYVVSARKPG